VLVALVVVAGVTTAVASSGAVSAKVSCEGVLAKPA